MVRNEASEVSPCCAQQVFTMTETTEDEQSSELHFSAFGKGSLGYHEKVEKRNLRKTDVHRLPFAILMRKYQKLTSLPILKKAILQKIEKTF